VDEQPRKLSRRDALKILTAVAGGAVLANIPSKWTKPELATGVLPAHAQTSICIALLVQVVSTDGSLSFGSIGPIPNNDFGEGAPLADLGWYCQAGCVAARIRLDTGTTAVVKITTISQNFTLNFSTGTPSHTILVNLGTGDYAVDGTGSAGSCTWPVA